jgi:mannose-1-phosphate guanylyltransferase/phosphomannomutase
MNRAVFLDRDGVINAALYNRVEGKLDTPYRLEDFKLLPGVARAIRAINEMGFLAVVVSNQPGVAKGKCDYAFLEAVDAELTTRLARQEAHLDAIYYCLHHPDAVDESLRVDCDCRKPKPGLLLRAAQELDIDLAGSFMLGDSPRDVEAGLAAGCRSILVDGHRAYFRLGEAARMRPHWTARNLLSAVEIIRCMQEGRPWRSS